MSSPAQLAANRANAQLSTGPRTEQGKAISSRNNFKHGFRGEFLFSRGQAEAQACDNRRLPAISSHALTSATN